MAYYWLIVSLSWIGSASLQYVGYEDRLAPDNFENPILSNFPLDEHDFYASMPSNNVDYNQREPALSDMSFPAILVPSSSLMRLRRTPEVSTMELKFPELTINDNEDAFAPSDSRISSVPILRYNKDSSENDASGQHKRSFSPWGGKRDIQNNSWTWKRADAMREPSMPKRVRFSPWGGKRSNRLIFKPGTKALKIILSKAIPELTRLISSYSPRSGSSVNLAGFQLLNGRDKSNPIGILTMTSSKSDERSKNALPFGAFLEAARIYKSGHPYSDVSVGKSDKRKVKFSAWGGKRTPPIIGPIWSPSTQNIRDNTLEKILLIRKDQITKKNI